MKVKKRLDVLLTERNLADSRSKAQAVIMSGLVYVDGQKADKPGVSYDETVEIEVRGAACPYVSRGGLKLEKALRDFGVKTEGCVCSDSGASTGGFTDCLLQHGAKKVFAIDVGYGQLDWKIRSDPRVVVMERTNIRPGTAGGAAGLVRGGRELYFVKAGSARDQNTVEAHRAGALPDQAPV